MVISDLEHLEVLGEEQKVVVGGGPGVVGGGPAVAVAACAKPPKELWSCLIEGWERPLVGRWPPT